MKEKVTRQDDYLKVIINLSQKGEVRGVDIVRVFDVTQHTVSIYLKQLAEEGDITMDEHHTVYLTQQGLAVAESTRNKHSTLYNLFCSLGVPSAVAAEDAWPSNII